MWGVNCARALYDLQHLGLQLLCSLGTVPAGVHSRRLGTGALGPGPLAPQGGPLKPSYASHFFTTTGGGGAHSTSPGPVPVLVWLLLYIHSYRTSVQLVFRAFSVTAALWFGCNFDVVVGGGEHSVHRLCRLAWKSRVRTDVPAFVERMYD